MDEQELCYWQEQMAECEEMGCTTDPDYDLDDEIAHMLQEDDERYWFASRF